MVHFFILGAKKNLVKFILFLWSKKIGGTIFLFGVQFLYLGSKKLGSPFFAGGGVQKNGGPIYFYFGGTKNEVQFYFYGKKQFGVKFWGG